MKRIAVGVVVLLLIAAGPGVSGNTGQLVTTACRPPRSDTLVQNVTFVAFDTETTGFSPTHDRIVEIGAIKFKNNTIIEERTWLINPQRPIPLWATEVHGITDADVADQPTFAQIYPEFLEFTRGCILIAHNARFDIAFITEEARRAGFAPPRCLVVDSLPLFRTWFRGAPSYSLGVIAEYTGVQTDVLHRALADSLYLMLVFQRGLERIPERLKLRDLYVQSGGPLSF